MSMCYLSSSFSGFMIWEHLPWAIFVFCLGACVGSFINVVVHRMPAGVSLLYPPSRCPTCGGRLLFPENLPILGWLTLRNSVSSVVFASVPGVRLDRAGHGDGVPWSRHAFSSGSPSRSMVGRGSPRWWSLQQFLRAWPAWICIALMLAALYAMTVIDARTFTIPLAIPVFITVTAFILWPVQGLLASDTGMDDVSPWPIQGVGWTLSLLALGGVLGSRGGVLAAVDRTIEDTAFPTTTTLWSLVRLWATIHMQTRNGCRNALPRARDPGHGHRCLSWSLP